MSKHTDPERMTRRALLSIAAATAIAASPRAVRAQPAAYPSKPVRLVLGSGAGGPVDTVARLLADYLAKDVGQPVVVVNRPGAGGQIALGAVARAEPDGYTLTLTNVSNAINQTLMPGPGFDINVDFTHVAQLIASDTALVVPADSRWRSLADLLAFARSNPGRINYASSGNGNSNHLAMEMLKSITGVSMLHIPYRGMGGAINDLFAGEIQAMFVNVETAVPLIRSGRLRPLGIGATTRNPMLPDVAPIAEQGVPGFEITTWLGVSGPKGLAPEIVDRIGKAVARVATGPYKGRQEAIGSRVLFRGAADYAAFVRAETQKWAKVIRFAGVKAG